MVRASPAVVAMPDFETIFQQELSYVVHSLRRLGVRESDLEDVAHDVFMTVDRLLPEFDSGRPLRPWLFGIAYHAAANYRRHRNRREVTTDALTIGDDSAPNAEDQVAAKEDRALVIEALDALDLDRRTVFVMHEIDGHLIPEIAEALAIPLNTAYSRLRLAREQFAAAVKRLQLRRGER